MFAMTPASPTQGKMDARKELRLHRADEERIRAAAAATGLQEADFIRQAALLRAQEVEQRLSLSILPVEAFDAFNRATRDMEAAVKADYEFHLSIARASNNPHFPALLQAAVRDVMLDLNIKHGGKTPEELEVYETRNVQEHEAILTAIMRRDPGAARAAMARHLGDSIARYRKLLSNPPA